MGRAPKVPGAVPEDGDLSTLAVAAPAISEESFAFMEVCLFDLPYVGAYDQAIRILGYPKRGYLRSFGGREAFMYRRRVLILTVALAFVCSVGGSVLAQKNNNDKGKQQPQRPPQEQQDVQALVTLVDTALLADTGVPIPAPGAQPATTPVTPKPLAFGAADKNEGDVSVKWQSNHFVKGQSGDTYVPFTLAVDKAQLSKGAALYVRIVSAEQASAFASAMVATATPPKDGKATPPPRPSFQWDSVHFLDAPDGQLSRAVQLKPGQYVAFIAVKEKSPAPAGNQRNNRNNDKNAPPAAAAAGPAGLLRHEITVPDFNTPDLRTSSVIVAQSVEPLTAALPADQQEANPYVFGPMRIVPSFDGRFPKTSELSVIFWIYGAKEAASGKPDVVVDYSFHQRLAEGEKYFNKTAPQPLNAETLPPQFSIAAGHQLPGSLVIPLTSFPAGDYRLEIKVTDKPSGAQLTQSVNFSVLPV